METQNEDLAKLRSRIERPRDWSATIYNSVGRPICVRDVTAWNWEQALAEMEKFCELDEIDQLHVDRSTLREDRHPRTIESIGHTETRYIQLPRCSDDY